MPPVRLFVGNLPYQATEDDLRTHFGQVGPPTQIVRPLDRETGRARGFAFVEFAERESAAAALARLRSDAPHLRAWLAAGASVSPLREALAR